MRFYKIAAAGLSVLSLAFFATKALTSAYEWINPFSIPGTWTVSGATSTVSWTTNTSASYDEYRTAYYYTTTTLQGPSDGDWTEWTDCRHQGSVYPSSNDQCSPPTPWVTTSSYLWVRITTNFSGCGTWTPTPDPNCGHYQQKRVDINP